MKVLLLLIPILVQHVLCTPNYGNLNLDDFALDSCRTAPSDYIQSPIQITNTACESYGSFDLQMGAVTDPTTIGTAQTPDSGSLQKVYTAAKLTVNGTTYTSTYISFRRTSEHVLPNVGVPSAAELQIEFESGDKNAVVSFLIKNLGAASATADNKLHQYFNSPYYSILRNLVPASNWNIDLPTLSSLIQQRVADDQFLNFFTYEGTLTYGTCERATWFIYGQELYVSSSLMADLTSFISTPNNRPLTPSQAGGGSGSHYARRMCYSGYFEVNMSDNYGLWFGVVSILLFFIFTLVMSDKPIEDPDYHEDVWTHHPLISIYKVGNDLHTRKSRAALFLVMITINALFASVFYRDAEDKQKNSNTIVFGVYAMLIDLVVTFFVGSLLRRYYLAKHQYYKTKDQSWEQKAQNRIFAYYITVFAIVIVGWCFCVWNMGELHAEVVQKPSELWVASLFIGLGLELLAVYPLACTMAIKSNFIRRIIRKVGFFYDNVCHETYLDHIKQD